MRRRENHHRLVGQKFVGEVVTEPLYRIIDLGRYRGLVCEQIICNSIRGELWEVEVKCLAELDEFESDQGSFARRPIEIEGPAGVEAYFWIGEG